MKTAVQRAMPHSGFPSHTIFQRGVYGVSFLAGAMCFFGSVSRTSAQHTTVWAWENPGYAAVMVPPNLTNVATVAANWGGSMALNRDGTVVGWGEGVPETLADLRDAAAISLGFKHGLVLRSNGVVVAWGEGPFGENVVPPGLSNVIAISAGGHHNLALRSDGTVAAWGKPGTALDVPAGLSNVVAISASTAYNSVNNLALRSDGTVAGWGENEFGQSNVPVGLSNVVAIAAGWSHSLALKSDGTIASWGSVAEGGQPPVGLSNVVAIAAAAWHSLALKNDGTVVAWRGGTSVAGAERVPANLSNVIAIAAGHIHSLAVSVNAAPSIRRHPQSLSPYESAEDGFGPLTVAAIGSPPLSYQWFKDGVPVVEGVITNGLWTPGTSSGLWVAATLPENGGNYTVVVSNAFGSVTSEPAVVSILPYLGIYEQPAGHDVYAGEDVVFSLHVKGTAPFHYQWRKNSNNLADATSATLTLSNVQVSDAGPYDVIVTNITGAVTSRVARLTVNPHIEPLITKQPQSEGVWPGAKAALRVAASGAPTLSYQWRKNGVELGAATNTGLVFDSAQLADAGTYDVIVSNTYGAVTSLVVSLTVTARAPVTFPPAGTVVNLTGAMLPEGLTNVVAVSAGRGHALALRSDGTVAAWGSSLAHFHGADVVPEGLSNVVSVSAGAETSFAVRDDGTVTSWGRMFGGAPPELYGVVKIVAGTFGGAAIKHNGRVAAWGQASSINNLSNVTNLAMSRSLALVVRTDGTVQSYGFPGPAPSLQNSVTDAVAAAIGANLIALRSSGTVVDLLSPNSSTLPPGLNDVVAISGSTGRNLVLNNDGTVLGWGNISVPPGFSNVTAIAAGDLYSLLVTTNPPAPSLAGAVEGSHILLSAPFAVSGYVLEATDDLAMPYTPVGVYTNTFDLNETNNPALIVPLSGERKFYRFRRQ